MNNNDDFLGAFRAKDGESLRSLRVTASFSRKGAADRIAESFLRTTKGKESISMAIVRLLMDSGHVTATALRSLLPKGRAGRRKIEVDKKTGKIRGTMREPSRKVVESFNGGHEPDQILKLLYPHLKTPRAKSQHTSQIKNVLRRNRHLLTRPYGKSRKKG